LVRPAADLAGSAPCRSGLDMRGTPGRPRALCLSLKFAGRYRKCPDEAVSKKFSPDPSCPSCLSALARLNGSLGPLSLLTDGFRLCLVPGGPGVSRAGPKSHC